MMIGFTLFLLCVIGVLVESLAAYFGLFDGEE